MNEAIRFASSANREAPALAGWVALCALASSTGLFVSIDGWYEGLAKPSWNPPAWLFGPVWSVLYVLMALSAWLIWRDGGWRRHRTALMLFVVQLLLNALWTPLFFGLHLPGWAMADLALLWLVLAATVFAFWRIHQMAALLLTPYFAWVTFAAILNFSIWRMNP